MDTVSATQLSRKTLEILDRVANGASYQITRNGVVVARIAPVPSVAMCATQALQGLRRTPSNATPTQAWLTEGRGHFDDTVGDPWA